MVAMATRRMATIIGAAVDGTHTRELLRRNWESAEAGRAEREMARRVDLLAAHLHECAATTAWTEGGMGHLSCLLADDDTYCTLLASQDFETHTWSFVIPAEFRLLPDTDEAEAVRISEQALIRLMQHRGGRRPLPYPVSRA